MLTDVVPEFRTVWSWTKRALRSLHLLAILFFMSPLPIPPINPRPHRRLELRIDRR